MFFKLATAVAILATFVQAAPCTGHADIIDDCTISGKIALTFDDGPRGNGYERKIGDMIKNAGGLTTFFLNGNNYGCIYDEENVQQIRYLYEQGHTIGSHTWSHADLKSLNRDQVHDELWRVEEALIRILGVRPRYFRPPYGNINTQAVDVLRERGYTKIWMWDSLTDDAVGASESAQKSAMTKIANAFPEPHLVLQHSVQDITANSVVPWQIPLLTGKGYQMVPVGKCIPGTEDWPYEYVGPYGTRDSNWKC